ncbi:MAG: hypothetical protein FWG64_00905 [Firmicutes bacterium]|nr:hypothetical protein [Bacillota bacterium]
MSKSTLWGLDFDNSPINQQMQTPPETFVKDYGVELRTITNLKLSAEVEPCFGLEFDKVNPELQKLFGLNFEKSKTEKLQKELGSVGKIPDIYHVYEFFVTSKYIPLYKYRIMFFMYTPMMYPVAIALDEDIAQDIGKTPKFTCETEHEFKESLQQIVQSNSVKTVINTMFGIARKAEFENDWANALEG